MQVFITNDKEKRCKVIDFFTKKKIAYCYTEQYTFLKTYDIKDGKSVNLALDNEVMFMFEWRNKQVKKEHLMAL